MSEGGKFGFRAFRVLLFVDGEDQTPPGAKWVELLSRLYDMMGLGHGSVSMNLPSRRTDGGRRQRPDDLETLLADLTRPWPDGEGADFFGTETLLDEEEPEGLPYLGFEQMHYTDYDLGGPGVYHILELALPPESPLIGEVMAVMEAAIAPLQPFYGLAGFGVFVPRVNESIGHYVVPALDQWRAALALVSREMHPLLKRTILTGSYRDHWRAPDLRHCAPGLPDIGWRTWIGRVYWSGVDVEALISAPPDGVQVELVGDVLAATAGNGPVWGALEEGDDLRPLHALARAVRPARGCTTLVEHHPFFHDMPTESLAYLMRFDGDIEADAPHRDAE